MVSIGEINRVNFINVLVDWEVTSEDLNAFRFALDHPQPGILVNHGLNRLSNSQIAFRDLKNLRARDVVQRLDQFTSSCSGSMEGVSIVVGGSLLYDDVKKGDVDICAIHDFDHPNQDTKRGAYIFEKLLPHFMGGYPIDYGVDINPINFFRRFDEGVNLSYKDAESIFFAIDDALKVILWRPIVRSSNFDIIKYYASEFVFKNRFNIALAYMFIKWDLVRRGIQ